MRASGEAPRYVRLGYLVAGAGAVLVAVALFLSWYRSFWESGRIRGLTTDPVEANAWEAFAVVDVLLASTALIVLVLAGVGLVRRDPRGLVAVAVLAALAAALIAYRLVKPPELQPPPTGTAEFHASRQLGAYLGFAGALVVVLSAPIAMALGRLALALRGVRPRKRCPQCASTVHADAHVCRHCGHRFA